MTGISRVYEDTYTYIKKRSSSRKIKDGLRLYKKEKSIIEIMKRNSSRKRIITCLDDRNKFWHISW